MFCSYRCLPWKYCGHRHDRYNGNNTHLKKKKTVNKCELHIIQGGLDNLCLRRTVKIILQSHKDYTATWLVTLHSRMDQLVTYTRKSKAINPTVTPTELNEHCSTGMKQVQLPIPQSIHKLKRANSNITVIIIIIIIIIIIMFMKDWACFLFLDPQYEIGPSISSSVVLCSFVLLVYIVVLV